jgi:hypothetical protein
MFHYFSIDAWLCYAALALVGLMGVIATRGPFLL